MDYILQSTDKNSSHRANFGQFKKFYNEYSNDWQQKAKFLQQRRWRKIRTLNDQD